MKIIGRLFHYSFPSWNFPLDKICLHKTNKDKDTTIQKPE